MSTANAPSPSKVSSMKTDMFYHRQSPRLENVRRHDDLKRAQRVIVKSGTSIQITPEGTPCLRRMAAIAEQVTTLRREGRDVIFVASGSIGYGRNILRRQRILSTSASDRLNSGSHGDAADAAPPLSGVAAAGQANLMALFQTLFGQLDVPVAEVLLTKYDFETDARRETMTESLETLLMHGIVPIVNENDCVSCGYDSRTATGLPFRDNDGLAALVAEQTNADLMVILTDVDGVYDRPPSDPNAKLISVYNEAEVVFGEKSGLGRGGMSAKLGAAKKAIESGVPAVCIVNGHNPEIVRDVCHGIPQGTLLVQNPAEFEGVSHHVEGQANAAREGSRALINLTSDERRAVIAAVATALDTNREKILEANKLDVEAAVKNNLALPLQRRLALTDAKISTLVSGIQSLAQQKDPLGKVLFRMTVSEGVELVKETVPIGVLLIIFESRPDSLPQIAALSLLSGNGLLLKGGKEAERSNKVLHSLIVDAVHSASNKRVPKGTIGLITNRTDIEGLLQLDKLIDLVIPRGSNAMVSHIQRSTKIPVMGHADGVCHTYLHSDAVLSTAIPTLVDAKLNYPAACNATETLLIDAALVKSGAAKEVLDALDAAGVEFLGGPKAMELKLCATAAPELKFEYGDNHLTIEVVENELEAIAWINTNSSHHTDAILTANKNVAEVFVKNVDSACVFHNCSTRMADGFRFGLGAEVGISTGRIHARGPVGVEGLMTQKWVMRGPAAADSLVTATAYNDGTATFVHKELAL